jgi:hypothetical protein
MEVTMRKHRTRWLIVGVVLGWQAVGSGTPAEAQSLGGLRWRLDPFAETVTFQVEQQGAVFVLSGFSERPGGARSAAYGTAFIRPDGAAGMGFTTVFDGIASSTDVILDITTLSGSWRDDSGNAGTFVFQP